MNTQDLQKNQLTAAKTRLLALGFEKEATLVQQLLDNSNSMLNLGLTDFEVKEALGKSYPQITGASLALAGFEYWDGFIATGDEDCQAHYSKFYDKFDGFNVEVEFYLFEPGLPQPNLKVTLKGGLQETIDVIGIPLEWSPQDLIDYCFSLVAGIRQRSQAHPSYSRRNAFDDMIYGRLALVPGKNPMTSDEVRAAINKLA